MCWGMPNVRRFSYWNERHFSVALKRCAHIWYTFSVGCAQRQLLGLYEFHLYIALWFIYSLTISFSGFRAKLSVQAQFCAAIAKCGLQNAEWCLFRGDMGKWCKLFSDNIYICVRSQSNLVSLDFVMWEIDSGCKIVYNLFDALESYKNVHLSQLYSAKRSECQLCAVLLFDLSA